ncbi:MAG: hypothetical protein LC793_06200 [Thermomicrobia bacterium]|nr:hypothetical protein [Thermomicrobia bacterium]
MAIGPFWSTDLLTMPHAPQHRRSNPRQRLGALLGILLVGLPVFLIPNTVPTTAHAAQRAAARTARTRTIPPARTGRQPT